MACYFFTGVCISIHTNRYPQGGRTVRRTVGRAYDYCHNYVGGNFEGGGLWSSWVVSRLVLPTPSLWISLWIRVGLSTMSVQSYPQGCPHSYPQVEHMFGCG